MKKHVENVIVLAKAALVRLHPSVPVVMTASILLLHLDALNAIPPVKLARAQEIKIVSLVFPEIDLMVQVNVKALA